MASRTLLVALSGLYFAGASADTCTVAFDNGVRLEGVALAVTIEDQVLGLSGIDSAGAGMLFAWEEEAHRAVWMRDTRMPLTAVFIAADGQVVRMTDMEPMSDDRHVSGAPARYVLEVAQGTLAGMGVGHESRINRIVCEAETGQR